MPELARQSVTNIQNAIPGLCPSSRPHSAPEPLAAPSGMHAWTARSGCTLLGEGTNWRIVHGNALSGEEAEGGRGGAAVVCLSACRCSSPLASI